jgi:hypothetical protein
VRRWRLNNAFQLSTGESALLVFRDGRRCAGNFPASGGNALTDLGVRIDEIREQLEKVQRFLKEVE